MEKRRGIVFVLGVGLLLGAALVGARTAWPGGGLLSGFDSADGRVREAAIQRVVRSGTGVLDALLLELETGAHEALVRHGIGEALRRIGVGTSEGARLSALLVSSNVEKRMAAVQALTSNGALARERLLAMAQDKGERLPLRCGAARALGTAGGGARAGLKALARDLTLPQDLRHAALDALALCVSASATDVVEIATDAQRPAADRERALFALAQAQSPGGAAALRGLLASGTAPGAIRPQALSALASLGATQDQALLAAALSDSAGEVRFAALRGLTRLSAEAAHLAQVEAMLTDAEERVQVTAIEMVGRVSPALGREVTTTLVGLLGDANFRVRYESALALYLHGNRSGAAAMQKDSVSANASEALMAAQLYARIVTLR